jgi:hypothetical protein
VTGTVQFMEQNVSIASTPVAFGFGLTIAQLPIGSCGICGPPWRRETKLPYGGSLQARRQPSIGKPRSRHDGRNDEAPTTRWLTDHCATSARPDNHRGKAGKPAAGAPPSATTQENKDPNYSKTITGTSSVDPG